MTSANTRQVGGEHYKGAYQHWDWAIDIKLGPLEYALTKYVARWRKKNGMQDLQKSLHYAEKLIEVVKAGRWRREVMYVPMERLQLTNKFAEENELGLWEQQVMLWAAQWVTVGDLDFLLRAIKSCIAEAEDEAAAQPGPGYVDQDHEGSTPD